MSRERPVRIVTIEQHIREFTHAIGHDVLTIDSDRITAVHELLRTALANYTQPVVSALFFDIDILLAEETDLLLLVRNRMLFDIIARQFIEHKSLAEVTGPFSGRRVKRT